MKRFLFFVKHYLSSFIISPIKRGMKLLVELYEYDSFFYFSIGGVILFSLHLMLMAYFDQGNHGTSPWRSSVIKAMIAFPGYTGKLKVGESIVNHRLVGGFYYNYLAPIRAALGYLVGRHAAVFCKVDSLHRRSAIG